jgi:hypothetical protein
LQTLGGLAALEPVQDRLVFEGLVEFPAVSAKCLFHIIEDRGATPKQSEGSFARLLGNKKTAPTTEPMGLAQEFLAELTDAIRHPLFETIFTDGLPEPNPRCREAIKKAHARQFLIYSNPSPSRMVKSAEAI